MAAKTGYEAWRERNLSLPFPDEFHIMRDGSLKLVRIFTLAAHSA